MRPRNGRTARTEGRSEDWIPHRRRVNRVTHDAFRISARLPRALARRPYLSYCLCIVAIGFDGGPVQDLQQSSTPNSQVASPKEGESGRSDEQRAGKPDDRPTRDEIRRLIIQLDSTRFEDRNQATRQLAAMGNAPVPHLVESLNQPSREIRFRSGELLRQNYSFAEVAPHLVKGVALSANSQARAILHERASWQIEIASRSPSTDQLLKFWGTNMTTFRVDVLTALAEAKTSTQTGKAVAPLLGLCEKAKQFETAMARLDALGLPYGHQYSSGFVIAQTLARGLNRDHSASADFAEAYLAALETLVHELELQGLQPHAIKTELIDRANYSRGAASYLVQVVDIDSPQSVVLLQRVDLPVERLMKGFFQGLASTDRQQCYRDVGKVHIVDMLTESISRWPSKPSSPVIQKLITDVKQTVDNGDKPKALALLDALDACWDLPNHQLNVDDGVGKLLGQRLLTAAEKAKDNRTYHPTRAVHDKFVALFDRAITPDHWAFPEELFGDFMQGNAAATSDAQRLALERYLRILEQIETAGIDRNSAGAKRFVQGMRDAVRADRDHLRDGIAELGRLLAVHSSPDNAKVISVALGQWQEETDTGKE